MWSFNVRLLIHAKRARRWYEATSLQSGDSFSFLFAETWNSRLMTDIQMWARSLLLRLDKPVLRRGASYVCALTPGWHFAKYKNVNMTLLQSVPLLKLVPSCYAATAVWESQSKGFLQVCKMLVSIRVRAVLVRTLKNKLPMLRNSSCDPTSSFSVSWKLCLWIHSLSAVSHVPFVLYQILFNMLWVATLPLFTLPLITQTAMKTKILLHQLSEY